MYVFYYILLVYISLYFSLNTPNGKEGVALFSGLWGIQGYYLNYSGNYMYHMI